MIEIHGDVADGFEPVKDLYERNMRTLVERQTQLCIYHRGKKVVDLWSSAEAHPGFSPDSLVNVFSSGKSLEAIAIATLVGKGLLDYDARVANYWPEFAANGKEALTIAELMRHEVQTSNPLAWLLNQPSTASSVTTDRASEGVPFIRRKPHQLLCIAKPDELLLQL